MVAVNRCSLAIRQIESGPAFHTAQHSEPCYILRYMYMGRRHKPADSSRLDTVMNVLDPM